MAWQFFATLQKHAMPSEPWELRSKLIKAVFIFIGEDFLATEGDVPVATSLGIWVLLLQDSPTAVTVTL